MDRLTVLEFAARSLDALRGNPPKPSMLILFDNGTPAPLRYALKGRVVVEAPTERSSPLPKPQGLTFLLRTDKNLRYQQNLKARKIAFVVIGNQQGPTLRRYVHRVVAAVNAATPGTLPKWKFLTKKPGPIFITAF